jgi:hypothetical protein
MQSENGILLLFFYISKSWKWEKKEKNMKKRGDAVSCPQVPVIFCSS